jgi:hypothetical protein
MVDTADSNGVKLVGLGFVAVIAIAGLVLLLTQTSVTGQVSSYQKLGTSGVMLRTPYEACRALHAGAEDGIVPVWNGFIDPRNNMIQCVSPTNPNKVYSVELLKKR